MTGAADTGGKDGGFGVDWPVPRFKDNKTIKIVEFIFSDGLKDIGHIFL